MIIVAGGIKGGSGKTTIATNLAVMRARDKADVLLIDADDQETSFDFTVLRNERTDNQAGYTCIKLTGAALRTETLRLSGMKWGLRNSDLRAGGGVSPQWWSKSFT